MNTTVPCTSHCFSTTLSILLTLIVGMGIGALGYKTYICPQDQKESMAANQTTPTPVQITPHGYLMGNYTVTDPATFQQYLDKAGSMAGKYGGKAIIFDTNVE